MIITKKDAVFHVVRLFKLPNVVCLHDFFTFLFSCITFKLKKKPLHDNLKAYYKLQKVRTLGSIILISELIQVAYSSVPSHSPLVAKTSNVRKREHRAFIYNTSQTLFKCSLQIKIGRWVPFHLCPSLFCTFCSLSLKKNLTKTTTRTELLSALRIHDEFC